MKITIQLTSPVKVERDAADVGINKTIKAVEKQNGPSKWAIASTRTKRRIANSLRSAATKLAEDIKEENEQ